VKTNWQITPPASRKAAQEVQAQMAEELKKVIND
jgi:hypothetical protein